MDEVNQKKQKILKFDFNERERQRFSTSLRSLSEMSQKAAAAILAGKDEEFLMNFTLFNIAYGQCHEIAKAMSNSMDNIKKRTDDFPEIVFEPEKG